MDKEAIEFFEEWSNKRTYMFTNKKEIGEVFMKLVELTESDTVRQFKRLIPRAIFIAVNREVKVDYLVAEYVGRLVENCSESKHVRREVQDLFFEVLAEDSSQDISPAFREAVKRYNIKHGYQCKHRST
jgi:phage-related minor tail protein